MDFVFKQTLFPIHFQGRNGKDAIYRNRNLNMSHLYMVILGGDLPKVFVHEHHQSEIRFSWEPRLWEHHRPRPSHSNLT